MNSNSKRQRDIAGRAPVPFEHFDEITAEMIERARKEANAPAADDPKWKVVESAW